MPKFTFEILVTFRYEGEIKAADEDEAKEIIREEGAETYGLENGAESNDGVEIYLTPVD